MQNKPLTAGDIVTAMKAPVPLYLYPEIDSTNTEAKRLLQNGIPAPFLVVAETQTAGRGRQGKTFYSPGNTGIYMTLAAPMPSDNTDAVALTCRAAVAVWRAVYRITGVTCGIKWVNDLYLGDRKICGILAEAAGTPDGVPHVLLGVGVNVFTRDFPGELQHTAAALSREQMDRAPLLAAIADELLLACTPTDPAEFLDIYRRHSMVLGKDITYTKNNMTYQAHAVAITPDGGLTVRHPDGTEATLHSGEISLRLRD